jgi:secreted Zn-dependent insulinase-like peptidase
LNNLFKIRFLSFIYFFQKENIDKMSDDEFQTHVEALALTKLEEPKKMSKQCEIYWNEIASHQYHFDREKVEVDELRKLKKEDLVQFFQVFCPYLHIQFF